MPSFEIETRVSAPKRVDVRLVYAEEKFVSNVFRVLFDICLAIDMAFVGAAASSSGPVASDRQILIAVLSVLAVVFLGLNLWFMFRSRRDS